MEKEELKQYLMQNLRINADIEDGRVGKRLVITLSLGRCEVIDETKLWI